GRQGAARKALGLPPVADAGRLGAWYDGSGNRLHLVQRVQAAQPRLLQRGKHAAVHFDGARTYLGVTGQDRTPKEVTLVVVAAPRSNGGGFRALVAANETGRNDYTSGFTVDLTGQSSALFDKLNVEGKGFGRAVNLLAGSSYPLGQFKTVEVLCQVGPK